MNDIKVKVFKRSLEKCASKSNITPNMLSMRSTLYILFSGNFNSPIISISLSTSGNTTGTTIG